MHRLLHSWVLFSSRFDVHIAAVPVTLVLATLELTTMDRRARSGEHRWLQLRVDDEFSSAYVTCISVIIINHT